MDRATVAIIAEGVLVIQKVVRAKDEWTEEHGVAVRC